MGSSVESGNDHKVERESGIFQLKPFYRKECRNMITSPTCSESEIRFICALLTQKYLQRVTEVVLPGYGLKHNTELLSKDIGQSTSLVVDGSYPDINLTIAVDSWRSARSVESRYEDVKLQNYPEIRFWGMRRVRPMVEFGSDSQDESKFWVGSLLPFEAYVVDLKYRQYLRVAEMMMDLLDTDEETKSRSIESLLATWSGDFHEEARIGRIWYREKGNLEKLLDV